LASTISDMASDKVPEPWRSLLADVDARSSQPIEMQSPR
jgi:hypothetical protein